MSTNVWSRAFARAFVPHPRMSVREWADAHRIVPPPSPEPGPWRTSRVPFMREIMEAISDPDVREIAVMLPSQMGKTELILNAIGYHMDQDPAAMLLVQPSEHAMHTFVKERVDPMIRASPRLKGRVSDEDSGDSEMMLKMFPGGFLACAWSRSPTSLASRPIRILLLDEIDRYPLSTGRDGDPIQQAIQRTSNYANSLVLVVATPTTVDESQIARRHGAITDRRRYEVPCPLCGGWQVLVWEMLVYKREDGEHDYEHAWIKCKHCGGRIEETAKPAMVAAGRWVSDNPGGPKRAYGQLEALLSPWVRWATLAEEWARASADKNFAGMQEFHNLRLGRPWATATNLVSAEALEKNREDYDAQVPDGVLILTAGVDVQGNRLEVEIVGWGAGRESWGIAYRVIAGDTADQTPMGPWPRLDEFLARTWQRADGTALGLACTFVDSGDGNRTAEVYAFTRERLTRNIFASKGHRGDGHVIVGKPTVTNAARVPLFVLGVDAAKDVLYARLAMAGVGPGYCHFPRDVATGYDQLYFPGLCSEQKAWHIVKGRRMSYWKQTRPRNEPLDCRVYALAAMEVLQPDFDALAKAREQQRREGPQVQAAVAQRAPGRRVYSRGVSV